MPQNEMVGPAHPWEMCVSLLPLTPEPCLTLDAEVAPNSDHFDSEDEVQIGRMMATTTEDNEDEYTALSKSLWKSKSAHAKPSIGSLEKCAKCSKRFTGHRGALVGGLWRASY
jgi:hypothetical protein